MSITLDSPLIPRLRESLPDDALLTDPDSLVAYAKDSAPFAEPGAAAVVALPSDADQVTHILRTAYALGIPVVPQGARTGLAGAGNAIDGCIVLSTERMNRIVEIDPANRLVRCQPGVGTAALDAAVGEFGLCYPPDPASHLTCTVGGNIATGAGGLCCVKYGVTADYVLGLELALIDGRTLSVGHRTVKGVAGYDLTRLIVGSEGTLAVILEATLALRPRRAPGLALLAEFPDLASAGAAVAAIIAAGQIPSALELLDRATSRAIADYGHPLMSGDSAATLIVESDNPDAKSDLETIAEICHLSGASKVTAANGPEDSRQILEARRLASPAMGAVVAGLPGRITAFIEDVAVPRSRLAELVAHIERIAERNRLRIFTLGHAGDGNLHPTVVFDQDDTDEARRARAAYDAIMAAALALGGTITGEHGVGLLKRDWLERELDPVSMELQRGVKKLFDPRNLLNPGKVIV